jgi:prepilin-type N-terminal cleavage/methylation domain-containing protein
MKQEFDKPSAGFSLMEVLASILLMSLLISVALQTMVSAVALKVGGNKVSHSQNWIQADLEAVRFVASKIPVEPSRCRNLDRGYALAIKEALGTGTPTQTFSSDGVNYQLQRQLTIGSDPSVLVVEYTVVPDTGAAITTLRTEVIPDAAFDCF